MFIKFILNKPYKHIIRGDETNEKFKRSRNYANSPYYNILGMICKHKINKL